MRKRKLSVQDEQNCEDRVRIPHSSMPEISTGPYQNSVDPHLSRRMAGSFCLEAKYGKRKCQSSGFVQVVG